MPDGGSSGPTGSSWHELRSAAFIVRTPPQTGSGAGGHEVFRLREGIRKANPFTPLNMTRFKRAMKRGRSASPRLGQPRRLSLHGPCLSERRNRFKDRIGLLRSGRHLSRISFTSFHSPAVTSNLAPHFRFVHHCPSTGSRAQKQSGRKIRPQLLCFTDFDP